MLARIQQMKVINWEKSFGMIRNCCTAIYLRIKVSCRRVILKDLLFFSIEWKSQSSGGNSSSEAFPRNDPRVFLKMLKVLSSCPPQNNVINTSFKNLQKGQKFVSPASSSWGIPPVELFLLNLLSPLQTSCSSLSSL